jgi:hypothetical protein
MKNIASNDYGTYHAFLIPEPDSPITVHWGSAVAESVARITKAGVNQGTRTGNTWGSVSVDYPSDNFQRMPFMKYYRWRESGTWTDEDMLGTACSLNHTPQSSAHFGTVGRGTSNLEIGITEQGWFGLGPVAYIVITYGR